LLKIIIDHEEVGEVLREKIVVEAADASGLLKAWVEALLTLAREQHILFKAFRFQEFNLERTGAGKLRSEISGELVDPLRHVFRTEVADLRCDEALLINNSKTIEAQVVLSSEKIDLAIPK
jgi:SHS2 domain-containing protein